MDETKKLDEIWNNFHRQLLQLEQSSSLYPPTWGELGPFASSTRRQGLYAASALTYIRAMEHERMAYVGLLEGLARTLAAGGKVFHAFTALTYVQWMAQSVQGVNGAAGFLEMVDIEMALLQSCLRSEAGMVKFLGQLSENPNYALPIPFNVITSEWSEGVAGLSASVRTSPDSRL